MEYGTIDLKICTKLKQPEFCGPIFSVFRCASCFCFYFSVRDGGGGREMFTLSHLLWWWWWWSNIWWWLMFLLWMLVDLGKSKTSGRNWNGILMKTKKNKNKNNKDKIKFKKKTKRKKIYSPIVAVVVVVDMNWTIKLLRFFTAIILNLNLDFFFCF